MGGDLWVTGGGTLSVSTAELGTQAVHLDSFADELDSCMNALTAADAVFNSWGILFSGTSGFAHFAELDMAAARIVLGVLRVEARGLVDSLNTAAYVYGAADHLAEQLATALAAQLAYSLGVAFPVILTWLGPGATVGLATAASGWLMSPQQSRDAALDWLAENSSALADPRVLELVRLGVGSADEFGLGLVHVPDELALLLGNESLGVLGLSSSAFVATGLANRMGLLKETSVSVNVHHTSGGVTPASSFEDRVRRIPNGEAQVKIEKYTIPGKPDHFAVYVGGTKDGGLTPGAEPWDMTSNMNALAMGGGGSTEAVKKAMQLSGITADSPVVFTGYSQGALVANVLASSGDYSVEGVLTVGGPVGQLDKPDAPYLAIEHSDDPVAALGGFHSDLDTVVVSKRAYGEGEAPAGGMFAAHSLTEYRETATELDASDDPRISEVGQKFTEFTAGASGVESTAYVAERVPSRGRTGRGGSF